MWPGWQGHAVRSLAPWVSERRRRSARCSAAEVAKEIWVCDGGVKKWEGGIQSYKQSLIKELDAKQKRQATAYRAKKGA